MCVLKVLSNGWIVSKRFGHNYGRFLGFFKEVFKAHS